MNKALIFANCALIFILSACSFVLIGNTSASSTPVGKVEVVHDEVEIDYYPPATVTVDYDEVEMIFIPAS